MSALAIAEPAEGARFAIHVWLHLQADHTTGTVWTNATKICLEIGFHPSSSAASSRPSAEKATCVTAA